MIAGGCLLVGVFLGGSILPSAFKTEPQSAVCDNNEKWKEKIQEIADNDLADYYRLKNLEDKYKKADEILGKIITVFFADLGIHISNKAVSLTKQVVAESDSGKPPRANQNENILESKASHAPTMLPQTSAEAWVAAEKQRFEIQNEQQITDFLRNVKISNFDDVLKASASYANKTNTLEALQGHFNGTAQVKIGEATRDWNVDLFLKAEMSGGSLQGVSQIKLEENGRVFSEHSDTGEVKAYKELAEGRAAVLVGAGPKTYFQLYYLKELDLLVGNVYQRVREGDPFTCIGSANLRRS